MSKIAIKRTIKLDFMGEEYKDAFVVMKSVSVGEADELAEAAREASENKNPNKWLINELEKRFVSGRFPDEKGELVDLSSEDLSSLDIVTASKLFEIITGQDVSPN